MRLQVDSTPRRVVTVWPVRLHLLHYLPLTCGSPGLGGCLTPGSCNTVDSLPSFPLSPTGEPAPSPEDTSSDQILAALSPGSVPSQPKTLSRARRPYDI